jgi:hypothetical protein
LFTYGAADPATLAVVVELPQGSTTRPQWQGGAEVQVTVAGAGNAAEPGVGRIEPGTRSTLVRMPRPAGAGPFRLSIKVLGTGAVVTDRLEVADRAWRVLGEAIVYRATPAAQSPLRPSADFQFWRTERVHVEWPVDGPLDQRSARLLSREGQPLAVPVQVTERERDGRAQLAADVNLSPLGAGDYVMELVAARGGTEVRRYVPIRVVR